MIYFHYQVLPYPKLRRSVGTQEVESLREGSRVPRRDGGKKTRTNDNKKTDTENPCQ